MISLKLQIDKIDGKGEDAGPVLELFEDGSGLVAVFDGMGGAGAKVYEWEGLSRTGAYFGSRFTKALTAAFFREQKNNGDLSDWPKALDKLSEEWHKMLTDAVKKLDQNPSMIRSSMMRRLPTTAAGGYFEKAGSEFNFRVFWAGDSRVYTLKPGAGLQQLTTDHTARKKDALESLYSDGRLVNCVHADEKTSLDHLEIKVAEPIIFIAASDGCFDYVPFPAHFEYILLDTMQSSNDSLEWSTAMAGRFRSIASDDVSMSLVAVGWDSFDGMKQAFNQRCQTLKAQFVGPIEAMELKLEKGEGNESELKVERNELRRSLWSEYRKNYEVYLTSEQTPETP